MIRFSGLEVISELSELVRQPNRFKDIKPETDITGDEVQEFWDAFFLKPIETDINEESIVQDVYGRSEDEFQFDFDIETPELKRLLYEFSRTCWDELPEDEKIKRIDQLVSMIGDQLGVEKKPQIEFYNAGIYDCGAYDPETNTIAINKANLDDPVEIVDTVAHEMRHAYQFQRAKNPQNYMDLLYAYNFTNYINPYVDKDGYVNFTDYQDQLIEAEARAFAKLFVMKEEDGTYE